jgi:hypothetical protein
VTNSTSESTVETIELIPHPKARSEPCHLGESSGGSSKRRPGLVETCGDKADEGRARQASLAQGSHAVTPAATITLSFRGDAIASNPE